MGELVRVGVALHAGKAGAFNDKHGFGFIVIITSNLFTVEVLIKREQVKILWE